MTWDFHTGVLFLRCGIIGTKPGQDFAECVRLKKEKHKVDMSSSSILCSVF